VKSLVRYAVGYVLDFLRERVTAEDFREEEIRRVLVGTGLSAAGLARVRQMFPHAELRTFHRNVSLLRVRAYGAQAAFIPMAGGGIRGRAVCLLSGARHKLLVPSPDYIYRVGMRRGWGALLWAVVDRFLVGPLALLWLGMTGLWLYLSGTVRRAVRAEMGGGSQGGAGNAVARTVRSSREWARRARLRRAYRRPPRRGPKLVQVGLTEACNYRCLMCPFHNPYVDEGHRDSELPRLPKDVFARLLQDLKDLGTEALDICGNGEPLMHPDAIEMIAMAREMGFEVRLATNGALLTEAKARRLVDLGVQRIHVSFNAGTEETYRTMHPGSRPGARTEITARLRDMAEYAEATEQRPVMVEFSAVLTRLNMGEIVEMVESAYEARAAQLMVIPMGPASVVGRARGREGVAPRSEDWPAILREAARAEEQARALGLSTNLQELKVTGSDEGTRSIYERIPCYIGHEFALILGDGSVHFCCYCELPLGNLHEEDFAAIWNSDDYQKAREQARALALTREAPPGCTCFYACSHVWTNIDIHRYLYGERAVRTSQ
jgi:MoaA/NifB/PqqE/SkfB family radical SAM enzyme